jgi:hypothetical protein
VSQLRINTDNSHHRYDVILLVSGVPVMQIELKTLAISPRRAIELQNSWVRHPRRARAKSYNNFGTIGDCKRTAAHILVPLANQSVRPKMSASNTRRRRAIFECISP